MPGRDIPFRVSMFFWLKSKLKLPLLLSNFRRFNFDLVNLRYRIPQYAIRKIYIVVNMHKEAALISVRRSWISANLLYKWCFVARLRFQPSLGIFREKILYFEKKKKMERQNICSTKNFDCFCLDAKIYWISPTPL